MQAKAGRIRTATDGAVACATMVWRYRGRHQLTVIVKASFAIVHNGMCAHAGPSPIIDTDRTYGSNPSRSVEHASDRVPYRPRCDVLVRGHAHAPGGQPVATHSIRIGVARDGRRLLDRVIGVVGDRDPCGAPQPFTRIALTWENALGGAGQPNPVGRERPNLVDPADPRRAVGVGAVSPFWSDRKRLLAGLDRRVLDQPVPTLPESTPWDYFQSAPVDQQIEPLAGGERLVLDGLHPSLPRVDTQLPIARGAVCLVDPGSAQWALEGTGTTFDLRCDTLVIDADQQTIEIVWRGRHEVDESALDGLIVLAALARPDAAPDFAELAARVISMGPAWGESSPSNPIGPEAGGAQPPTRTNEIAARKGEVGESTVGLGTHAARAASQAAALPFAVSESTARVASEPHRPSPTDATPWASAPILKAPAVIPGEGTLDTRRRAGAVERPVAAAAVPGESTYALRPQDQAAILQRPVAPFEVGAPKPTSSPGGSVPWKEARSQPLEVHDEDTTTAILDVARAVAAAAPSAPGLAPISPMAETHQSIAVLRAGLPHRSAPAEPRPADPKRAPAGAIGADSALVEQLKSGGASSDDIASLLDAIAPPKKP